VRYKFNSVGKAQAGAAGWLTLRTDQPRWSTTMVIVTGSAVAREDAQAEMEKISLEHVLRSCTEPGCISQAINPR
jgi:hypothetical protein